MFTRFIFHALYDLIVLLRKPPFNVLCCIKACKYKYYIEHVLFIVLTVNNIVFLNLISVLLACVRLHG